MNPDGSGVKRLTHQLGYDGGPFFSPDGKWIVYRAHHPTAVDEVARYKSLLAEDLVEPMQMDLYVMRADGSEQRQITNLGGASFAPFFFPDSQRIIFASNYQHPGTSEFELYAVNRDGSKLEPHYLHWRLQCLPAVLSGWQAVGFRIQPQRQAAA